MFGFRFGLRRQICIDAEGAQDFVRENFEERVVQRFLELLRLQDFAGEFVREGHQQCCTDQSFCLGQDDEAALPGRDAIVLFQACGPPCARNFRRVNLVRVHLDTPQKLNLLRPLPDSAPEIHRLIHRRWIRGS